jgi:hypothetical protein
VWTKINQVYTSRDAQNCWAHLVGTNAWHRVLPGAADGVTNVHAVLSAGRATDRQVYVALDANKNITAAYL